MKSRTEIAGEDAKSLHFFPFSIWVYNDRLLYSFTLDMSPYCSSNFNNFNHLFIYCTRFIFSWETISDFLASKQCKKERLISCKRRLWWCLWWSGSGQTTVEMVSTDDGSFYTVLSTDSLSHFICCFCVWWNVSERTFHISSMMSLPGLYINFEGEILITSFDTPSDRWNDTDDLRKDNETRIGRIKKWIMNAENKYNQISNSKFLEKFKKYISSSKHNVVMLNGQVL